MQHVIISIHVPCAVMCTVNITNAKEPVELVLKPPKHSLSQTLSWI